MIQGSAAIHRIRLWWRRGGRDQAIAAFGVALLLIVVIVTIVSRNRQPAGGGDTPYFRSPEPNLVALTLLGNAAEKGAFCLDGSPPGYHLQRGFGSGSESWLLHLEGGGWCDTLASCSYRAGTALGSSRYMEHQAVFAGILSQDPLQNPDFYNWNRVKIRYCDGGSFSGDVETEVQNGRKLFFRGQRIWEAIIDELLTKGLSNAKQVFLTGCSAGGLATFIHCDSFRALMPKETSVKCLADAGFFLDEKDISGKRTMRSFYHDVVHLQNIGKSLPKDCTTRMEPSQCIFPHELVKSIKTPVFILNPAYDFWQIRNILAPESSDPQGTWLRCSQNIHDCDSNQIEVLHGFRTSMLNSLSEFQHNRDGGMFMDSCYLHCQTVGNITWHSQKSPRIKNKTIAEAVGNWYFGRREEKAIDCPYPCNPTCQHMNFN